MKYVKMALCLLLATAMLLGLCACTGDVQPTEPTQATEPGETEPVQTQPTEPAPTEEALDPVTSLTALREKMANTSQLAAVAYLGYVNVHMEDDMLEILKQLCPEFFDDLLFITQIQDEHIIGGPLGELYLIVPRDETASVQIDLLENDSDGGSTVADTLYHENYGDPLLVYANGGSVRPDILVSITAADGTVLEWTPCLDEAGLVSQPTGAAQILDLTIYREAETNNYDSWLEDGWSMPQEAQLTSTDWTYVDFTGDQEIIYCLELLDGGEARLSARIDGKKGLREEYQGDWNTYVEEDFRYLNLNLERTDGQLYQAGEEPVIIVDTFPLLIHFTERYLMLGHGLHRALLPFPIDTEITAVFAGAEVS